MSITLTGQNYFIRCNTPRLQAGVDPVEDAPESSLNGEVITNFGAAATASDQIIAITFATGWISTWHATDDVFALIYVGCPQNASRKYFGGPWRYCGKVEGNTTTPLTSPQDVAVSPWLFAEGQRLWVKARITEADGRLGAPAIANFLCAA